MDGNDFKCDKCQKDTYVIIILSLHKFPKHDITGMEIKCICGYFFQNRTSYLDHMKWGGRLTTSMWSTTTRCQITQKKIYPCWMFVHLSFKSRGLSTWVTALWALIRFFSLVMWLLSTAQCVLCAVRCHSTVSFLAQVLDTVTYFVSQVLEVATVTYFYIYW